MDFKTNVKRLNFFLEKLGRLEYNYYFCTRFRKDTGKSYTASSLRILQDGNVAKVVGCSGAM